MDLQELYNILQPYGCVALYTTGSTCIGIKSNHDTDIIVYYDDEQYVEQLQELINNYRDQWDLHLQKTDSFKLRNRIPIWVTLFLYIKHEAGDIIAPAYTLDIHLKIFKYIAFRYNWNATKLSSRYWYYLLLGLYTIHNRSTQLTEEQKNNIQLAHDGNFTKELKEWCLAYLQHQTDDDLVCLTDDQIWNYIEDYYNLTYTNNKINIWPTDNSFKFSTTYNNWNKHRTLCYCSKPEFISLIFKQYCWNDDLNRLFATTEFINEKNIQAEELKNKWDKYHNSHKGNQYNYITTNGLVDLENFIGIGMECEISSNCSNVVNFQQNCQNLLKNDPEYKQTFFVERDASVSYGFEFITQPHDIESMEIFIQNKLANLLSQFQNYGAVSSRLNTAIHFHVSKRIYGNDWKTPVANLLWFFSENEEAIHRLTDRPHEWSPILIFNSYNDAVQYVNGNNVKIRHSAINFNPQNTFEFRIFNSTLDYKQILDMLHFVWHITNKALNVDPGDASWEHWMNDAPSFTELNSK